MSPFQLLQSEPLQCYWDAEKERMMKSPKGPIRFSWSINHAAGDEELRVALIARGGGCAFKGEQYIRWYLFLAEDGTFYGIKRLTNGLSLPSEHDLATNAAKFVVKLDSAKAALQWLLNFSVYEAYVREQFRSVVEHLEFDFTPFLSPNEKKQQRAKRRKAKKTQPPHPFAIQLQLATALVASVRGLHDAPAMETLAEARRNASALHRALHSETAFKEVWKAVAA